MDPRRNNFDLLRLVFAASVLVWHAFELSRQPALHGLTHVFSADAGVKAFFVVSGYLVVMSFENSSSLREYAGKRARRIYPAYFAVVLLCALGGLLFSSLPAGAELLGGVARYLAANLTFLNFLAPTLPGVFADNAWREMNGALWTLKIEVMFYAAVPLIVWACRRLGSGRTLAVLYLLSLLYTFVLGTLAQRPEPLFWIQLQRQLPGQLTYFLAGAALYLYRESAARYWPFLLAGALALYLAQRLSGEPLVTAALEPLWLGISVVYAACGLPYLGNFARYGDLSYGIYIIHFPVIQVLVALGWFARDPWAAFAVAVAITIALAFASWHLVEKRLLKRSSHYRVAASTA